MAFEKPSPACLYHPISVLFVDDNESFLAALKHDLGYYEKMLTCADPRAALRMIRASEATLTETLAPMTERIESEKATEVTINLLMDRLHQPLYNPHRHQVIVVMFIDYLMPEMDGIAFAKQLKAMNLLKAEFVMLTAQADEHTAVQAFNAGWIDQFLIKTGGITLNQTIRDYIEAAKHRYFQRLSQTLQQNLGAAFLQLINSAAFKTVFYEVFQKAHATEYYLIDPNGSYLFLDDAANPTWLIVQDQATIDETVEMLTANAIDADTITRVKARRQLLFLPAEADYKRPDALGQYLFDAHALDASHYYSIATGKITTLIDWHKIQPCRQGTLE